MPSNLINSSYSVYAIDGSLVEGGMLVGQISRIDLTGLDSGSYSVVINSVEGMHTQQVVLE